MNFNWKSLQLLLYILNRDLTHYKNFWCVDFKWWQFYSFDMRFWFPCAEGLIPKKCSVSLFRTNCFSPIVTEMAFGGLSRTATTLISIRTIIAILSLHKRQKITGSPSQTRTLANALQNRVSQKKSPLKFIYNQTVHTNGNDLPWEVMQEKCQHWKSHTFYHKACLYVMTSALSHICITWFYASIDDLIKWFKETDSRSDPKINIW